MFSNTIIIKRSNILGLDSVEEGELSSYIDGHWVVVVGCGEKVVLELDGVGSGDGEMDDVGEGEIEWGWNGENVGMGVVGFIFLLAVEEANKEWLLLNGATTSTSATDFLSYNNIRAREAAPAVTAIPNRITSSNFIVSTNTSWNKI